MLELSEPKNKFGRLVQVVVTVWTICVAMGLLTAFFSEVFEVSMRDWSPWVQLPVFVAVCVFVFLIKMTKFGEDGERVRRGLPEIAPTRDGVNARFHERAKS